MENQTQKFCSILLLFSSVSTFDHGAALKIERKMSHLNIAFDLYASIGTIMHYILLISVLVFLLLPPLRNFFLPLPLRAEHKSKN